ncbi:hypothetical protein chiPu_0032684 [Chiloscyllium punctatum]|uniref:Murine leukemia virus integrase C-terminal domain-containing protein n=1 Tax=Chiloscyllium punctatum TaxID=137246 RepID=A0A401U171_CHIPU|nr:hypothetical protein [Chiloscyllium punctatum]
MSDGGETSLSYKSYCDQLTALVSAFSKQVGSEKGVLQSQPPSTTDGVVKVIKRKWSEPRWTGPYRVVERTSHAVRLQGKGESWYYWSQCAATEPPTRTLEQIRTENE